MQRLLPKPSSNGVHAASDAVPPPQTAPLTLPTFILVPITPGPPPLHCNRPTRAAKKRSLQPVDNATRTKIPRTDESIRELSIAPDENCSDPNQCRRCVDVGDEPCVLHSLLISDTPTVARAYGSLPSQLYIAQKEGMLAPGVFAKRAIPHPSVFGPLLAPLTPHPVAAFAVDHRFGLRQKKGPRGENAGVRVFDLRSDDLCNWIKFVREAVDAEQQNLVAFQQDDHVYLATTKNIPAETELCFWYSTKYCQLLNKEILSPGFSTQENINAYGDDSADFKANTDVPMDALCSATPTAATSFTISEDANVLQNALPAVDDDPSPARVSPPRRRRVMTVDTAIRPCYLWFRKEEDCLVDWFVNPDNCRQWKRAGRNAAEGRRSKLHLAGLISSYLVENGCASIAPEIIKRKIAALEAKALQPETDRMPAHVRRFRDAYHAVNLADDVADDNTITNSLPDATPTGLMAAHRPPRKGRPTGWCSMEERWLMEWFAEPDNCRLWKTSLLHHTENDVAKNIAAYLLERGGQNFPERPPLNILRKIRLFEAQLSEPVADDAPEDVVSLFRTAYNAVVVNEEEAGSLDEDAAALGKRHSWSLEEEAVLVESLEKKEDAARWRPHAPQETRVRDGEKARVAGIVRQRLVERCGAHNARRWLWNIRKKAAQLLTGWEMANAYMQSVGKPEMTLTEAWKLKRLVAEREIRPVVDSYLTAVRDDTEAGHPSARNQQTSQDNLEQILTFFSRKALHHRIWPPVDSKTEVTVCECRDGCGAQFTLKLARDLHVLRHRAGPWTTGAFNPLCPACDFSPASWTALFDHLDEQHQFFDFAADTENVPHLKLRHELKKKQDKKTKKTKKRCRKFPVCEHCGMEFIHKEVRSIHYLKHSPTLPDAAGEIRQCPACTFFADDLPALIAHVDERHTRKDLHTCARCQQSFISYRRLERHIQRSHLWSDAEKPYECPTCHKKFSVNSAFTRHLNTHLDGDPISCPLCDNEKFRKTALLYDHMRQAHTVNGQLVCSHCDKHFPAVCKEHFRNFRAHVRRHVATEQFPCNICGKIFKRSSARSKHVEGVHSVSRPHVCHCGKSYDTRGHLAQHLRVVHRKDKVDGRKNATGGKSAAQNKDYVPPQKTKHYTEFPYQCEECQQGFVRRGMFAYHLTVRHPGRSLDSEPQLMLSSTAVHPNP